MKKILVLVPVLWVQLVGAARADITAQVTFLLGTPSAVKVEIVRDAITMDVTTSYFPCGASFCAIVPQGTTAGTYNYKVRVTDNLARTVDSNIVPLIIAAPPAPACQTVAIVVTTGTPTAAPTKTP